jgi:4-amino-4-deoxy-L-arabinose transferase-like glycosyltransferase
VSTRTALIALAALTLLRLAVAAATPLSADEAYYWVWSRALAPGYLDHPPMVALWIAAGTALAGDTNLGIRLLAPLSAAIGSLLLAQAAHDLLPGPPETRRRAAILAAALMNATLLFGIGSVTMTPDTPLLFFWTATLWALARLQATGNPTWWLAAGAAAGLAGASKYSAVLMLPGILLWTLAIAAHRAWLRRWHPWAAAALALILILPVLAWNAEHDWISLIKQATRGGDATPLRMLQFEAELIAGQLGLATPAIAILCAAGIATALRRGTRDQPGWVLLAGLSAMPAVVFVLQALGARVQANWPGILYPAACIAAAGLGARWHRWANPGIALGLAVTALVWLQAAMTPLALPMRLDPTLLRLGGWQTLADDIAVAARRENATFVASDNYGHAALLARLLPPDLVVIGLEDRWSLFRLPDARATLAGQPGLLLRSARRDDRPDLRDWTSLDPLTTLDRQRRGMTAEGFRLYRGTFRQGDQPAALLPRPNGDMPR